MPSSDQPSVGTKKAFEVVKREVVHPLLFGLKIAALIGPPLIVIALARKIGK